MPAPASQCAVLGLLLGLTVLLSAGQALTGVHELALFFAPLLLILGLLLSGRHLGEERLVRIVERARARWARVAWIRPRRAGERVLASLLERSPRSLRGPPAPAAA